MSRLTSTRGPFAFFPHQTISNRAARLATSSSITAASSSRNRGVIVTLPDQPNFENLVHHLSDYYPVSDGSVSTLASRSASLSPDRLLLRSIRVSIFGNRAVDMLMHHYLVHVADLLVPVVHSRNTFRDLYFPGAVRGAVIHQTIANDLQTQTQSTLYHSVLAAAAFHLWNCQRGTSQYRDIALQHKSRALGFLQAAVNHAAPNANNEDLIIAMLSLVTIGVSSKYLSSQLVFSPVPNR